MAPMLYNMGPMLYNMDLHVVQHGLHVAQHGPVLHNMDSCCATWAHAVHMCTTSDHVVQHARPCCTTWNHVVQHGSMLCNIVNLAGSDGLVSLCPGRGPEAPSSGPEAPSSGPEAPSARPLNLLLRRASKRPLRLPGRSSHTRV